MRILALWFPDWPIQAAVMENLADMTQPVIITAKDQVKVCNAAARAKGVRRGMLTRHAQALIGDAVVLADTPDRDGRVFLTITEGLDAAAAHIEVVRPGLVLIDAQAATKFHGGQDKAAEKCIDAVARQGVDCFAGIADDISTAIIAARRGAVVPIGKSREFLHTQPTSLLRAEPSLGCAAKDVLLLEKVGLKTLGDVAALEAAAMVNRFGAPGLYMHQIATATWQPQVQVSPPVADRAVRYVPDQPIERVDAAAFAARQLAVQLHDLLRKQELSCLRLKITAIMGEVSYERIWRTTAALTEQMTADRVRWQLDGWLNSHQQCSGISELIIDPIECVNPQAHSLWATVEQSQTLQVIEKVQSAIGVDKVLSPYAAGGRGVAERIKFVPYGEYYHSPYDGPWRGAIRGPLPGHLAGDQQEEVQLISAVAKQIYVTADVVLSDSPASFNRAGQVFAVTGWAGPWPVLRRWWLGEKPCARLQLVGVDAEGKKQGWLLVWEGDWRVEASYE
jgi:hypothetical protein